MSGKKEDFLGSDFLLDDPRKPTYHVGALCWQEIAVLNQIKWAKQPPWVGGALMPELLWA